ncbi:MAG TPA: serine/threonine-protein kinase [Vicinamibacteria bacterium]
MTRDLIQPRSDGRDSSAAARIAARGLPPDLLREAGRRLELASLVLAAAYLFALVVTMGMQASGWRVLPRPAAHAAVALAMIAVSVAVAWIAHRALLPPGRLLDLGLAYEVLVAAGISMNDNLVPVEAGGVPMATISWLCVWIVMFPLVVPATPRKALAASVAAASTWPVAFYVGLALGNPAPPRAVALTNFLENYLAAALALVPTLVLRRLGAAVQKAREMGSYELVERLDRGGMGEVWRARHRMLARPAAVKLIRPDRLGLGGGEVAASLLRRFEREAQATATLHSPHTIELYDFGVTRDGVFYYVMEMLDGLDLESLVHRFGPVPADRAVHFLLQACDSLADAHHAGLIHRDIKPANLYACRRGRKHDFLKVLDFGLVKSSWADEGSNPRLTTEGMITGTPAYMAPEVARGERAIDARVDLYGLGCVAYWLLTGRTVFDGSTPMQLALQHVNTLPVPPSKRSELPIPAAVEEVVLACLEKDPARRPASADDLGARLSACAVTGWTPERARRWWDAHMPVAAATL